MTCIVGLVKPKTDEDAGTICFGADSSATDYRNLDKNIVSDTKVFIKNDMIFGCSGSFRLCQIVKYFFDPPARPDTFDSMTYLVMCFAPELKKLLVENEYGQSDEESIHLLLGYQNCLYEVLSDLTIMPLNRPYGAIGSGKPYAIGSLASSQGYMETRIREALRIAEENTCTVCSPFELTWLIEEVQSGEQEKTPV